ncbi:pro-cathepsin H-like [Oncorhynchus kisutch]|uniref:pro-cathepsin H-like n=1 Tax=Oncorhynchus kisutch TaxID=8019 RepID=UPI0012DDE738|nr:pro-cathepsin H-like [Oncorhynchus kisutch]
MKWIGYSSHVMHWLRNTRGSMTLYTVAFILAFLHLANLTPLFLPEEEYHFKQWMLQYNKVYALEEYHHRLNIFTGHKRRIHYHNAGKHTFSMGLNQFSDMSFVEFRKTFLLTEPQNCSATKGSHISSHGPYPGSVDWREKGNYVSPVKYQGHCGSCWTFSTTGCLESVTAIATGKLPLLSEQQLMDCAQDFNNHGCMGLVAYSTILKSHELITPVLHVTSMPPDAYCSYLSTKTSFRYCNVLVSGDSQARRLSMLNTTMDS